MNYIPLLSRVLFMTCRNSRLSVVKMKSTGGNDGKSVGLKKYYRSIPFAFMICKCAANAGTT